ncbi:hypothetical protein H072_3579 [Dactylellina haptotyla CBS 200.50]|uniref:Uncharacterized protein n=1 Tax=Dactylellina haptotyla (strain CBS 200.50) TaxID=1284197 RepID=S8AHQ8_DACHA|nr:hypothetical protein H072_3579 [Dactylellina haptotyla CBS 200.50]
MAFSRTAGAVSGGRSRGSSAGSWFAMILSSRWWGGGGCGVGGTSCETCGRRFIKPEKFKPAKNPVRASTVLSRRNTRYITYRGSASPLSVAFKKPAFAARHSPAHGRPSSIKMNAPGETLDLYEVLGLSKTASKAEIKKAYHKAALAHHPDKQPEHLREEAEIKFKIVSQAYEILSDDEKKEHYDRFGIDGINNPGMGGPEMDFEDFINMFGGMGGMPGMPHMHGMHGMPGMGGGPGGPGGKPRGRDVVHQYEVTLEDLYKGKTVKFGSSRNVLCPSCKGTGGKEGAKPKECGSCHGSGHTTSLRQIGRGLVTRDEVPCPVCHGNGTIFKEKEKCKKCKGACVKEEKKVLEIYIPRGAKNGEKIVLQGEADEVPGYTTGDIIFVVNEKPHDSFAREGADLTHTVKITLQEAICGFSRVVLKHLDGRGISIEHKRGTMLQEGQILKVEGEGMPHKRGDTKGNLFLIVELIWPTEEWLADDNNIAKIKAVLPDGPLPEIEPVEQIDEVKFAVADPEEIEHGHGPHGGAWVDEDSDDDDEEGANVQCQQQ